MSLIQITLRLFSFVFIYSSVSTLTAMISFISAIQFKGEYALYLLIYFIVLCFQLFIFIIFFFQPKWILRIISKNIESSELKEVDVYLLLQIGIILISCWYIFIGIKSVISFILEYSILFNTSLFTDNDRKEIIKKAISQIDNIISALFGVALIKYSGKFTNYLKKKVIINIRTDSPSPSMAQEIDVMPGKTST